MGDGGTIFLSIVGGGSALAFFEFLIKRHDSKKEKHDEVLQEVKSVRKDVSEFKKEVEGRFNTIDRKVDDGQAIQARARILRFSDEMQGGHVFSQEAWNQTFEDISMYNDHCKKYEDFTNAKAETAVNNIIRVHAELLARERSGEKVFL